MTDVIVITLTPAQLNANGHRLARWVIETTDGRALAAGKRAVPITEGRPYFTQEDAADVLRRAKLPTWRHVRAATTHRAGRQGWLAMQTGHPHNAAYGRTKAEARIALACRGCDRLVFDFTPSRGYRLATVELQTHAGEVTAYRLTCVLDTDRGDHDARYTVAPVGIRGGLVVWMASFCGEPCARTPVPSMGEALAVRDAHHAARQAHTSPGGTN